MGPDAVTLRFWPAAASAATGFLVGSAMVAESASLVFPTNEVSVIPSGRILRSAVQLSGALMGGIYRFDGELIHLAGVHGATSVQARARVRC